MTTTLRYTIDAGVARITLTRADEYNTITPQLRADLEERSLALARRIALVPANQLAMIKTALNEVARHAYDPSGSRRLGTLYDGIARHTQERLDFVTRSAEVGFREAVRERDRPFGDYGERRSD